MKKFFKDVLIKLTVTILFALLMMIGSYCLVTGEFPPNFKNMKNGVLNLQTQIKQINQVRDQQLAQLSKIADSIDESIKHDIGSPASEVPSLDQAELKYQQALLDKIKELEARISRLENQNR